MFATTVGTLHSNPQRTIRFHTVRMALDLSVVDFEQPSVCNLVSNSKLLIYVSDVRVRSTIRLAVAISDAQPASRRDWFYHTFCASQRFQP